MARISTRSRAEVPEEVGQVFDKFMTQRGNIPNMFRTLAHRPRHMVTAYEHFAAVMGEGTVPVRLKEMVGVRVSTLNACEY
ncbi:MAG: hypothetical protein HYZ53_15205 [Planctomycetes bacterium]|nr:hypothetical protein [Planctomycetota bacterium]